MTAQVLRRVAILTQPFMPAAMTKLLDLLAVPSEERDFAHIDGLQEPGIALPLPTAIFPRYIEPDESKEAE
jgi:methionyl-tRNA synthetase